MNEILLKLINILPVWYLEMVILIIVFYHILKTVCKNNSMTIIKQLNKWHSREIKKDNIINKKLDNIDKRVATLENFINKKKENQND